jgi:hypothetical protein
MRKIVINKCFGGYSLSTEAMLRLRELGCQQAIDEPILVGEKYKDGSVVTEQYFSHGRDIPRDEPLLIQVVEELGEKANGKYAKLKIVTIPDDIEWEIDEYDGQESVREVYRSWG